MELLEFKNKAFALFGVEKSSDLSTAIMKSGFTEKIFDDYNAIVGDTQKDWMKHLFQYYEADREEKKQDYTPICLADSVAFLSRTENEKVCLDMCAGSGALTIQKWQSNKELHFICQEYDKNVIPFLLFNLAYRNISATVLHCDVLSGDVFKAYAVKKGERYATVSEIEPIKQVKSDCCISNPPYNMKWTPPVFAQAQPRFANCELPPESNANYAFILTALDNSNRVSMIMPTAILSTENKSEKEIRKYLVNNNLIDSIVINPDKMFEITSIGTCLITLSKNRQTTKIEMVDMREHYTVEKREQNGQYGGSSHENRTYIKEYKTYSDDQQKEMLAAISGFSSINGFSKAVTIQDVKENGYTLVPSRYIDREEVELTHRPYRDIVADITRIVEERNILKLTVNETIAKSLGLYDLFLMSKKSDEIDINKSIECLGLGVKIPKENFITCTKNKGEMKFENMSKDKLSTIFLSILQMWKQHIMFLNEQENVYLAELRDAMLPDLMSGKIEI